MQFYHKLRTAMKMSLRMKSYYFSSEQVLNFTDFANSAAFVFVCILWWNNVLADHLFVFLEQRSSYFSSEHRFTDVFVSALHCEDTIVCDFISFASCRVIIMQGSIPTMLGFSWVIMILTGGGSIIWIPTVLILTWWWYSTEASYSHHILTLD